LQKTNQVRAEMIYLRNGTKLGEPRIIKAKKLLKEFGLIEYVKETKTGRIYIKLNTIPNQKIMKEILEKSTPIESTPVEMITVIENTTIENAPKCLNEKNKCLNESINESDDSLKEKQVSPDQKASLRNRIQDNKNNVPIKKINQLSYEKSNDITKFVLEELTGYQTDTLHGTEEVPFYLLEARSRHLQLICVSRD
jgi:hypothetical protein